MLRVSRQPTDLQSDTLLLKLAGQVSGPWVDELRRACGAAVEDGGMGTTLALDLAEVLYLDAAGVALLNGLRTSGVRLLNGSAFITAQLEGVSDVDRY